MPTAAADWIPWQEFAALTAVPYSTFARWRDDKFCPLLGRALGIRSKRKGPSAGPKVFVRRQDAEALAAARKPWDGAITIKGELYLSSAEAKRRHGLSADVLETCQAKASPLLGRKLRGQTVEVVEAVEAVGATGKIRRKPRRVWSDADLARLAADKLPAADRDWLTHDQVKARFGFGTMTLWEWEKDGCPHIDGRKPRSRERRAVVVRKGRRHHQDVKEWFRPDLDDIAKNHNTNPRASADPNWLTYLEAKRRFGVGLSTLNYWATKNCRALGRKLATKISRAGVGNRVMKVVKYSRAELEQIKTGQAAPASPGAHRARRNKRPEEQKHREWKAMRDDGKSYGEIAQLWSKRGQPTSADAVKKALKRL